MTHILVEYVNTPPAAAPTAQQRNGQRTDAMANERGKREASTSDRHSAAARSQQSSSASATLSATSYHVLST